MQKRCLGVVGSILELNAYHGTQFAFDISKSIDMVTIRLAMNNFYFIDFFCRTWGDETGRIFPSTPDAVFLNNGFRCYWILRRIQDLTGLDIAEASSPEHWGDDPDYAAFQEKAAEKERYDPNEFNDKNDSKEETVAIAHQVKTLDKKIKKTQELAGLVDGSANEEAKFEIFFNEFLHVFQKSQSSAFEFSADRLIFYKNMSRSASETSTPMLC